MTPYELRRLADRKRDEANALVASASRLRATSRAFRDLMGEIPTRSQQVWQGPAAADFEDGALRVDRTLREQASVVVDAAAGFDAEAADLRAEAQRLDSRAAAAEAAATAPPGLPMPSGTG